VAGREARGRRRDGLFLLTVSALALHFLGAGVIGASAQTLEGTVLEEGSGVPVAGAQAWLEDPDGGRVASFVTARDGRYRLRAPGAGPYLLVVDRIGYRRERAGPLELHPDDTVIRDVRLAQRAIELEGLVVGTAPRQCDLRDGGSGATQTVWDLVRRALDAATWTDRAGVLDFRVRRWERRLDAGSLSVLDEDASVSSTRGGNSVRSLPADALAADGYVRTTPDGFIEYFAPDAEVLLSDTFLERHCFSAREGEDSMDGYVGLTFEPLPDSDRSDVTGIMWVDRNTGRLDHVAFGYTGLPFEAGADHAGGRVRYAELPDGRWIVRDWRIRAPVVRVLRIRGPEGPVERQMTEAVLETGAEVVRVAGSDFEWSSETPVVDISGVVYDSTSASTLPGATVRLAGRGWSVTTDEDGAFRIEGIHPGRYRLTVEHPRLDALGLGRLLRDVAVDGSGPVDVRLAVPERAAPSVRADRDAPGAAPGDTTAPDARPGAALRDAPGPDRALGLVGRVTDAATGQPVAGASIELVDATGDVTDTFRTDAGGSFAALVTRPPAARLRVSAEGYRSVEGQPIPEDVARHRVEVELAPEALEIEGVVVTTEARSLALDGAGFYDRMRTTPGTFLEREALRLESTTRLSDALMRTEGLERFDNASFSGDTTKRLVQFRAAVRITGRPNCLPAVYVDGHLARWGETVDPDELALYPSIDELVPPDAIEGVELYDTPASIPPRFLGPGSLCGVIVVWTRR
jgi:hypothetical protein